MVNWTGTNYFQNVSDLKGILGVVNDQTGGWGWVTLLGMMFIILVLNLVGWGIEASLLSASFIILVAGIFLVYLQLISWQWLLLYLGIILLVILYITWQSKQGD